MHKQHDPLPSEEVAISLCCICQTDYVGSLSVNERIERLVSGFIRQIPCDSTVPVEVPALCRKYAGDSFCFDGYALMTRKEYKRAIGKDCCGYATCCGKLKRNRRQIYDSIRALLYLLLVIAVVWGKDIAALVVAVIYDCNDAWSNKGAAPLGDLSITAWLYAAGIGNIVFGFMWMCALCGGPQNSGIVDALVYCGGGEYSCVSCIPRYLLFLITATLYFLWTVFGFILWSDMDPRHPCSKMVLSWSIVESVLACFGFCCAYPFLVMLVRMCDKMDDD